MSHSPLGSTGLSTAKLCLGTVKFGRQTGVKYPTPVHIPDDRQVRELFATAQALGINLLDTAPAYGRSEARIGELLVGQRKRWLLCTKVGEEFIDGESHYDFSPEHCRQSVERSLQRLRTDYLDIVLLHSNGEDLDILHHQCSLQALQALRDEGKIRVIGMSHKTVAGGYAAIAQGADVLMATLNVDYTDELPLISDAAAQGVGVLIKKAMSSGHGQAKDLAYVATQVGVHSIVCGTTNTAHLAENAAIIAEA